MSNRVKELGLKVTFTEKSCFLAFIQCHTSPLVGYWIAYANLFKGQWLKNLLFRSVKTYVVCANQLNRSSLWLIRNFALQFVSLVEHVYLQSWSHNFVDFVLFCFVFSLSFILVCIVCEDSIFLIFKIIHWNYTHQHSEDLQFTRKYTYMELTFCYVPSESLIWFGCKHGWQTCLTSHIQLQFDIQHVLYAKPRQRAVSCNFILHVEHRRETGINLLI